jgi:hypothetical protein
LPIPTQASQPLVARKQPITIKAATTSSTRLALSCRKRPRRLAATSATSSSSPAIRALLGSMNIPSWKQRQPRGGAVSGRAQSRR